MSCEKMDDPVTSSAEKPNIIYILADDLGYGDVGAYGQQYIKTPNIDRLADQGMMFTDHYSGSTVCAPSRASLITGLHTGHVQIRGNFELGGYTDADERGQMPLEQGTFTIGTLMKQAGYRTAVIGKWGMGGPGSIGEPNNHGFDHFFGYLDQKQSHSYYPTHLWRNGERVALGNDYIPQHQRFEGDPDNPADYDKYKGQDYAPDHITREAIEFINLSNEQPFFLLLTYTAPHAALQVPDEELTQYEDMIEVAPYLASDGDYTPHIRPRAARAAMISRMDSDIGKVIASLKNLGIGENTMVIFTSDNGPATEGGEDIEFFNGAGGYRGIKRDLYEGGIRVPMIASWPGKITRGSKSDHVSAFWDVMATLSDITGVDTPDNNGISFLPTLLGDGDQQTHDYLYWEFHGNWQGSNGSQAVRMGNWKAVRLDAKNTPDNPLELYDLSIDPYEINNVAANHPDIVEMANRFMDERTPSKIDDWNFN